MMPWWEVMVRMTIATGVLVGLYYVGRRATGEKRR